CQRSARLQSFGIPKHGCDERRSTGGSLQSNPGAPARRAGNVRYISNHGFSWQLLTAGKAAYQQIAKPLDPQIVDKFYNMRGVQFKRGKVVNGSVVSQTWKRVPPTFDPNHDADPLTDKLGPG